MVTSAGAPSAFPPRIFFLHRKVAPISGVFAVQMFGLEGEPVNGVANVGSRPTVDGTRTLLEVHLFDFSGDIYGGHVQVDFLHKIRSERRFESLRH